MNDLDDIYRLLAAPRTQQELANDYRTVLRQGERFLGPAAEPARPIRLLAEAIPPSATVNTAIHTLHALPKNLQDGLTEQLLEIAHRNVVDALGCCQRALELDGADHSYRADEWLPIVCDIAGPLIRSARPDTEPPTLVQVTQEAISWLSRSIAELDEHSEDAPTSLAEALARLLAVWTFTDLALRHRPSA
ncbi:MAG: hypothetical protein JO243_12390 [Solirubrobacterales bacterium]|nr:hypothetical protein [Solirubrobacterales bacterium]